MLIIINIDFPKKRKKRMHKTSNMAKYLISIEAHQSLSVKIFINEKTSRIHLILPPSERYSLKEKRKKL